MLIVQKVALDAAKQIAKLVPRIQKFDRDLVIQLRRATHRMVLNTAEGGGNDPGTGRSRFFTANGSADTPRVRDHLSMSEANQNALDIRLQLDARPERPKERALCP